jgi:IS5 family transposase
MLKPNDPTSQMLLKTEAEVFNTLISPEHPFRQLKTIIDFNELVFPLRKLYSEIGTNGIAIEKGFLALLIQFWEDYSDRQMEKCLKENIAVRWFCNFGLLERTPDYSYLSKLRNRIGTQELANIFKQINTTLEAKGLFGNVFAFIDASTIVTKTALWEERDKAIADGAEKLNNANVVKYAADKDARWGAKNKKKIWFGYKRHQAVDMRHGLISKVAVTPANVPDFKVTDQIAPNTGTVFSDKLYDTKSNDLVLKAKGLHASTIRKNNNKTKNHQLDSWRSKIRMPFEGTFSKFSHRARYRGKVKVLFQVFAESICHNLKKAVTILPHAQTA